MKNTRASERYATASRGNVSVSFDLGDHPFVDQEVLSINLEGFSCKPHASIVKLSKEGFSEVKRISFAYNFHDFDLILKGKIAWLEGSHHPVMGCEFLDLDPPKVKHLAAVILEVIKAQAKASCL